MDQSQLKPEQQISRRERLLALITILSRHRYRYHDHGGRPEQYATKVLKRIEYLQLLNHEADSYRQLLLKADGRDFDLELELEFSDIFELYQERTGQKLPEPPPVLKQPQLEQQIRPELYGWEQEDQQSAAVFERIRELLNQDSSSRIILLTPDPERDCKALCGQLEDQTIGWQQHYHCDPLTNAKVRDIVAWLAVATSPWSHSAALRVLRRPPIALTNDDIARCCSQARRGKVDLITATQQALTQQQLTANGQAAAHTLARLYGQIQTLCLQQPTEHLVSGITDSLWQSLSRQDHNCIKHLNQLTLRLSASAQSDTASALAAQLLQIAQLTAVKDHLPQLCNSRYGPGNITIKELGQAQPSDCDHLLILNADSTQLPRPADHSFDPLPAALVPQQKPDEIRKQQAQHSLNLLINQLNKTAKSAAIYSANSKQRRPARIINTLIELSGGERQQLTAEVTPPKPVYHQLQAQLQQRIEFDLQRVAEAATLPQLHSDQPVTLASARYLSLIQAQITKQLSEHDLTTRLAEIKATLKGSTTPQITELLPNPSLTATEQLQHTLSQLEDKQSLDSFLPRHGNGLVMSASDITNYLTCPYRYRLTKIMSAPRITTVNQRFGVLIHNVLDRFYELPEPRSLADIFGLLEEGWGRGGFSNDQADLKLKAKATTALSNFYLDCAEEAQDPAWRERSFSFQLGEHLLRGRVDRVDRLADGSYRLIDYKTGRPRPANELNNDVQLTLYAVAAREDWGIKAGALSYHYLLDNVKSDLPEDPQAQERLKTRIDDVAKLILEQRFEPKPSFGSCNQCEFKITCPAHDY